MTCEICGKPIVGDEWTSVDIVVHPECSTLIDNMLETRKNQKAELDEIIAIIKEVYDQCEVDPCYNGCTKAIEKLEEFRDSL